MFEGLIEIKLYEAVERDGELVPGRLIESKNQKNSITATGITSLLNGRMFVDGGWPDIHIYSHNHPITPAVCTVSGYLDTCTSLGAPVFSTNEGQEYTMVSVSGRLSPPGVSRTIRTVGLGPAASTSSPSFAVKLTNPVVQAPAQIVDITYNIIARKTNATSVAASTTTVSKVSNNMWSTFLEQAFGEEVPTTATPWSEIRDVTFLQTPDDFSTGTSIAGNNALVQNLGTTGANTITLADIGISALPDYTTYNDEGTAVVTQAIAADEAVGFNFSKVLISSDVGLHCYVNDVAYDPAQITFTAQNLFLHSSTSNLPYPNLNETFAIGSGSLVVDAPVGYTNKLPTYVTAKILTSGVIGVADYALSVQFTPGFLDNDVSAEDVYRLPALSKRDVGGTHLNTYNSGVAYTGADLETFTPGAVEAFSVRLSDTIGSTYVGTNLQSDAIGFPTADSLTVVANLGTTISRISAAEYSAFTATNIGSVAVVRSGVADNVFLACSNTGLWQIAENSVDGVWTPYPPSTVAVPTVTSTQCYAVSSLGVTGDQTLFAIFEGGLARSLNGGAAWTVYNASGAAGTILFQHTGLTDSNWSNAEAVIAGPTDPFSGESVIAIVLADSTIVWVELTPTTATVTGTTSIPGSAQGAFLTQKAHAYFMANAGHFGSVPSSQHWIFSTGTSYVSVPYTYNSGPGSTTTSTIDIHTNMVKARLFEIADPSTGDMGMVVYSESRASVVLVDPTFVIVLDPETVYTASASGLTRITNASCRPYRHFYLSSLPQFALFNPFSNAVLGGDVARHLVTRDYSWSGTEWVRITDGSAPTGRLIHSTAETMFSSSLGGITEDIPIGPTLMFEPNDGVIPFRENEFFTFTLTSGLQKDEYSTVTHTSLHSFYRTEALVTTAVQATGTDLADLYLPFVTRDQDTYCFSQQGVTSVIDEPIGRFVRSEATTLSTSHNFAFKFKVTAQSSSGVLAVGVGASGLPVALPGGDTVGMHLPVRISFTGQTYQVFREDSSGTAALTLSEGDEFTISIDRGAGTFTVSVNGVALALSVSNTVPTSLDGELLAAGIWAQNNENRYVYDARLATLPTANGSYSYYKLIDPDTSSPIYDDPLFLTVESRTTNPTTFAVNNIVAVVHTDPKSIAAVGEIKLLPKMGLVIANDVADISTATFNTITYKR